MANTREETTFECELENKWNKAGKEEKGRILRNISSCSFFHLTLFIPSFVLRSTRDGAFNLPKGIESFHHFIWNWFLSTISNESLWVDSQSRDIRFNYKITFEFSCFSKKFLIKNGICIRLVLVESSRLRMPSSLFRVGLCDRFNNSQASPRFFQVLVYSSLACWRIIKMQNQEDYKSESNHPLRLWPMKRLCINTHTHTHDISNPQNLFKFLHHFKSNGFVVVIFLKTEDSDEKEK